MGYPSEIWWDIDQKFNETGEISEATLKEIYLKRIRKYKCDSLASFIVLFSQFPALPLYLFMVKFRVYGFYTPKLPYELSKPLEKKMEERNIPVSLNSNNRWAKLVEHYVANNFSSSYTRMYNYLIIYGALRILAFINLAILWHITLVNIYHQYNYGLSFQFSYFFQYCLSATIYVASVMAFAKFNRRYFEECILAFLLKNED